MSKITRITLNNLTAFAHLEQSFSPGVNVLIGANGTGKTHLLKTLYAACAITVGEDIDRGFGLKLSSVVRPYEGRVGRLSRRQGTSVTTRIAITREGGSRLTAEFSNPTLTGKPGANVLPGRRYGNDSHLPGQSLLREQSQLQRS